MAFTKSERLKIIVWGTGYVGKMVLRDLIGHPLFELVGVIVNNPEKDGVDVGTLIGRDPIGLACSTDIDEVLSRDAVAVEGQARGRQRPVQRPRRHRDWSPAAVDQVAEELGHLGVGPAWKMAT